MRSNPEGSPPHESIRAGVVGLGHAGLPLAVEMALSGCRVTGIDTDLAKVSEINAGRTTVSDVDERTLAGLVRGGRLKAGADYAALQTCDAVSICVPTPLRKTRDPDLTHVLEAVQAFTPHLRAGMLVVLESTTYPGTTEECVRPALEASGLRAGADFHLCYSPERVDPGNPEFCTRNIPKIIGGITPRCLEAGMAFYSQFIETLVPVSSTLAAETAKLLENTFRMVNIALANETAVLCDRMGIDVWEVIEAAASKPFGFLPFYPGPGLGGHCVPVDPHFLSWKARQAGYEPQLIRLASEINGAMPRHVVDRVQSVLNDAGKPTKGSRVHLVGVAYKRNVSDTRESPAVDIAALLARRGARVTYSDPHVRSIRAGAVQLHRAPLEDAARRCDICVILADHDGVDYPALLEAAPVVLDTRNALAGATAPNLVRL
ncbi:MAG: nucleotide sugar dehydrogenase [Bryobacterales bacterium]|nr:nucleotide sugar dehydrogenase [Bryobacterales bacterium]